MNLSKFDGHTPGPWERAAIVSLAGTSMILINGAKATDTDLALMVSAPALLARVRELEEALGVLKQCFPDGSGGREKLTELLAKEWL